MMTVEAATQARQLVMELQARRQAQGSMPPDASGGAGAQVVQQQQEIPQAVIASTMHACGHDESALAIARQLGRQGKMNINELLENAGYLHLPHHLQPSAKAFEILWTDSQIAQKEQSVRMAYTYLDLEREVTPGWMPEEMAGGKSAMDEALTSAGTEEATLAKLSTALDKVGEKKRMYKRVSLWQVAFHKYGIAATSTGQWDLTCQVAHEDTILQLAETEAVLKGPQIGNATALLYDEIRQKSWSARTHKRDPTLNALKLLAKEAGTQDDATVQVARAKVALVLKANGTIKSTKLTAIGTDMSAEQKSADAKTSAAASALTRRANEAMRALSKQQDEMMRKAESLSDPWNNHEAQHYKGKATWYDDDKGKKGKWWHKGNSKGKGKHGAEKEWKGGSHGGKK